MNPLPETYLHQMKNLLQDEFDAYVASFQEPSPVSLRVNTNKISVEEFQQKFPYTLKPIPWTTDGFYVLDDIRLGKDPYYYAGLYYIQEPSAMLPAEILDVKKGNHVLDLCAAPGGKSTKIACELQDTGFLFANDISVSRSQVLLRNLERFGVRNSFVCSENPEKLVDYFPQYFDRILVDAPCSGQGMFRKEPALIHSYIERDESYYVPLQKTIITQAIKMLKPGGRLVYSTCTFSTCEDEEIIQYALSLDESLRVIPIQYCDGFVQNEYGTKLFPHRIKGEGHFVSILEKQGSLVNKEYVTRDEEIRFDNLSLKLSGGKRVLRTNKTYYVPETDVNLEGLRLLRTGLFLEEDKGKRMEINPTLAMALYENEYDQSISFDRDDPQIWKYLKGETITIDKTKYHDGYVVICVDGYPCGFGLIKKGIFKNKYPRSWIIH